MRVEAACTERTVTVPVVEVSAWYPIHSSSVLFDDCVLYTKHDISRIAHTMIKINSPSPLGFWASSCWVWCNDSASGTAGTSSPAPAVPTCAPRRPGRPPRRASRVCIRGRKGGRSPLKARTAYPPSSASREQSRGRCRIQPWRMPPRVRPRVEAARSPPGTRAGARTRRERVPSQPRTHAVEPRRRQPAP